jgi:hypothetical protein
VPESSDEERLYQMMIGHIREIETKADNVRELLWEIRARVKAMEDAEYEPRVRKLEDAKIRLGVYFLIMGGIGSVIGTSIINGVFQWLFQRAHTGP